jgi:hypothetical protein
MAAMALLGAAVMWSARDRMAFSGSTGTGWRKALD